MDYHNHSHEFLEEDATFERRWQALSLNNQAVFERLALASGGEVAHDGGLMWTYAPTGPEAAITISAVDPLQIGAQTDRMLDWYRERRPHQGAICWYLRPESPGDLAARLFARGFEPNWQPYWMWFDLRHLQNHARSSTFEIQLVEDMSPWQIEDLPNYSPEESATVAALTRARPQHLWQLLAFQHRQPVGRCLLNVTTGEHGIAGLFAMGVVPAARKQGIGTALAQSACELAGQLGCHHVYLNSTPMGEPIYRRVGFRALGYGHTWLLRAHMLAASPPTGDQVRFLEAIGCGDIATLDEIGPRLDDDFFHKPTLNGLTPLDIAVRCRQPASASWLVRHGVPLDLLSAWDLGWKERIPALLAARPELVNLQRGQWHATPLHIAIERGDLAFAKLLLTVPNDLTIKDATFHATAPEWARFFKRAEIGELIKEHL